MVDLAMLLLLTGACAKSGRLLDLADVPFPDLVRCQVGNFDFAELGQDVRGRAAPNVISRLAIVR
jgi:hypothetical protein